MKCTDIFTKELKKKIDKTREGRGGNGIYKRRNSRSYRVIIHYNTYLKILKNNKKILDHYKRGYVVRIKPDDYFEKNGEVKKNFHKTLELGKNAFLYFKNINDWNKYKSYCSDFEEVAELYSGYRSAGTYTALWNAENMASGVYYVNVTHDNGQVQNMKAVLLK